jgi:hypothetical protein
MVFDTMGRADLWLYERLVDALHKWLDGKGGLDGWDTVPAGYQELMDLCREHGRGPMPALAAVLSAYLTARGSLEDAVETPSVGPFYFLAQARWTAALALYAARDMPAELRWQVNRLRELLPAP